MNHLTAVCILVTAVIGLMLNYYAYKSLTDSSLVWQEKKKKKKRPISSINGAEPDSLDYGSDDNLALFSLDDDLNSEDDNDCFYDTTDFVQYSFTEIDDMFEDYSVDRQYIYDYLKTFLSTYSNDEEFLWRMAKATYLLTKTTEYNRSSRRKELLFEMLDYSKKAIEIDDTSYNCHKWYAMAVGALNEFVDLKDKLVFGRLFKKHLLIAHSLKEDDSTLNHLIGRFYFEILSLSWIQRKIANTFAGGTEEVNYPNALRYFERAHELKPDWKENILFITRCHLALKNLEQAALFCEKGIAVISISEDEIHEKLLELKQSIKS